MNSRKFISKILHSPAPIPPESPTPDTPHSPGPVLLVTPMDRYAGLWMLSYHKHLFVIAMPVYTNAPYPPNSRCPNPRRSSLGTGAGLSYDPPKSLRHQGVCVPTVC